MMLRNKAQGTLSRVRYVRIVVGTSVIRASVSLGQFGDQPMTLQSRLLIDSLNLQAFVSGIALIPLSTHKIPHADLVLGSHSV